MSLCRERERTTMHPSASVQQRPARLLVVLILVFTIGLGVVTTRLMTTSSPSSFHPAASPPDGGERMWEAGGILALSPAETMVYISGEVHQPGVYTMPPDARVHDVVVAAQGLTNQADQEQTNLAAHIEDAQHIHIPRAEEPPPLVVSIAGEVHRPDVYHMPAGARVYDVVMAAQGLTDRADRDRVNLAAPLEDAQHLFIPRREDPTSPEGRTLSPIHIADTIPSPAPGLDPDLVRQTATNPSLESSPAPAAAVVNINTATRADLETLEGIGPVLSQRIIDYRTTHGAFASVEALQNIRGISPAMIETLREYLTVGHE